MAKPSKAYLELMAKLEQNKQEELQIQNESALDKAHDQKVMMESNERLMAPIIEANKRRNAIMEHTKFRQNVKGSILEGILNVLVQKVLPDIIHEDAFVHGFIKGFIEEEGVDKLLSDMKTKTCLLSELASDIDDAYEDSTESIDPKDPDTFVASDSKTVDLISKVESDEEIDAVADIIRNKVSRATDEFIEKNVMDQTEIKGILQDTKNRMAEVRTGDDTVDEEIRQEATVRAKKQVKAIRNRPHTVFEQLVVNIAEAALKNEDLKLQYVKEDGKLDMDKIVNKATCIYSVLETVNTLKIKEFSTEDIEHYITFD